MVLLLLIYWSNEFDPTKRLRRGVTIFSDKFNRVDLFRIVVFETPLSELDTSLLVLAATQAMR